MIYRPLRKSGCGGLGVLAGDHIKSASDLDVPLIGVGLFYGQGYFRQRLDSTGRQQEEYLQTDVSRLPMEAAIGINGEPVMVQIETRTGAIRAKVWRLKVGRCDLLLLDSNVEGNAPEDRELTSRLYGGDSRVRIRQELLLGVGGFRALKAMNITPGVLHLNEGHSGFAVLEAIRTRMQEEGRGFEDTVPRVAREVVFTTHTPVPAGHDRFESSLIEEHPGPLRDSLGLSHDRLMGLGREDTSNHREEFCMTVLGLRLSRRFATYKRANLILADIELLASMINDPKRPVQFVYAGKAHPRDEPGKRVLQQIAEMMRDRQFGDKFVFVENYDINVGRHLVQGVDVWLNNPRRPLEASGTSGQKVVLNGGLNLSVLDGWWAEAYDGSNGFAIGTGRTHSNMDVHDSRDGEDLYRTLREEVIPLYYQCDRDCLPRGWIKRMKRTIRTLCWRFNANRMVMDYTLKCYVPAAGGISNDLRRRY